MFWGNILEVRTPWGPFELGLGDSGRGDPRSGWRVATPEEADQAWFFFSANLEFPAWSEIGPVLIRHQWSVCGGEYRGRQIPDQPTRDTPFVGYLQICLEEGLF